MPSPSRSTVIVSYLIALAGGAKSPVYETFVRLTRDVVTVTIPMEALVEPRRKYLRVAWGRADFGSPPANLFCVRSDGPNTQVSFNAEKVTLAEALAKAGGLQDLRADPAGVFLFRFEPPDVVDALKARALAPGPVVTPPLSTASTLATPTLIFLHSASLSRTKISSTSPMPGSTSYKSSSRC